MEKRKASSSSRAAEKSLGYRVKFGDLITAISAQFINLAPEEIDSGIQEALGKIGKVAGADRSYVFLLRNSRLDNTHEWCARGIPPHKDKFQGLSAQSFPRWMAKLRRLENIHIPHVHDLPARAKAEKQIMQSLKVKSLIVVPMVLNNSLVGFLGVASVRQEKKWPEDTISLLKIVSEIFVNALERKRAEESLRENENKYRALFEGVPVGLYRTSSDGKILDLNPTMVQMLGYEAKASALGKNAGQFYLDQKDRERATAILAQEKVLRNFDFQLKQPGGKMIWVQDNVHAALDSQGRVLYYEGSLLDITRQKQEEGALQKRAGQVIRHQAALLELAKLNLSDLSSALKTITEIDSQTLDVDRVSIWFFNSEYTEIFCRDLYTRSNDRHDNGAALKAREYPRYFRALEKSRVISADDVFSDQRTNEFAENYLEPLGITSMLDVPVRRHGQVVGIICHEHTDPARKWSLEEQNFAISVGDIVALALEALESKRMEKVNESVFKISEATNSSKNLDELFRSIHQVISNLMPAGNFYIALYDSLHDCLSFPYFVDEYDPPPAPKKLGKGLTEYVLRTGKPLLASPEVFAELVKQGEVESIGTPSIDWLGVPLNIAGKTIGVLVVQTYTKGVRYGEEEKNILKFVSDQVAMAINRKKTEEELQERERFLSSVFESIQDGISILDEDYRIIRVNPAMEKWYAHAMPLVGKRCYEAYHLRNDNCPTCPTRTTFETAQAAYEVVPKIGTGGEVTGWLDLYSFPLIDQKTGQMKGVIEYVRDITERKKAEDRLQASLREKEVLLREIHHRVKNNMQVISSLLNLQSRHISDPNVLEMFKESQRRIRSMALIHERLYQSSDLSRIEFSQYLRNLATHLLHSYQVDSSRIRLTLDAEEVFLNINTAIPCGLIVNELVSNALKHGFPDGRSGEVAVELHKIAGDGYELKVRDDGIGFPEGLDFRQTQTLGMQIVVTLVSQIDASIELRSERGTEFKVIFQEVKYWQRT
jgi:PAS domain S-box-containing protein